MLKYFVVIPAALFAFTGRVGCFGIPDPAPDAGADSGEDLAFAASCDFGTRCTDVYTDLGVPSGDVWGPVTSGCTARGGAPSGSPCPSAGRAGTCVQTDSVAIADGGSVAIYPMDRVYTGYAGDPAADCLAHGGHYFPG